MGGEWGGGSEVGGEGIVFLSAPSSLEMEKARKKFFFFFFVTPEVEVKLLLRRSIGGGISWEASLSGEMTFR